MCKWWQPGPDYSIGGHWSLCGQLLLEIAIRSGECWVRIIDLKLVTIVAAGTAIASAATVAEAAAVEAIEAATSTIATAVLIKNIFNLEDCEIHVNMKKEK